MGFLSTLLDIVGFGIGIPIGLLVGFFLFVYSQPKDVQVGVVSYKILSSGFVFS